MWPHNELEPVAKPSMIEVFAGLADTAVRASTPLVLAGLGSLIYERSGVINLAPEAFMLIGAITAVIVNVETGMVAGAFACAMVATLLFAVLHGVICVFTRINQVALGLSYVIISAGISAVVGQPYLGQRVVVTLSVGAWTSDTGLGLFHGDPISLVTPFLCIAAWYLLYRLRLGLRLRIAGESATAARAIGVPVPFVRLSAGAACGALSGLSGAYLALVVASQWQQDLVAGRGWLAIILVILAQWHPLRLLGIGYVLGLLLTLPLYLQAVGTAVSSYLIQLALYAGCVLAMALSRLAAHGRLAGAPTDLGRPLS